MKKILFLISFLLIGCGGEIYYLDSFNYSQSGEATYETKELEAENLEGAFTEAYEIIADEIISVYSDALNKDNSLGGVDNEIKALEFLNQALFNYEIFTVNREKMRINITDKEFDRKSILKDSILNKSRIKNLSLSSIPNNPNLSLIILSHFSSYFFSKELIISVANSIDLF